MTKNHPRTVKLN